jgi:anaerobic selenocysteine-containing dehydrogenase
MRRVGAKGEGRFERISWDDAIAEIATRLQRTAGEFGTEAILPYSYAGTMGLLNGSGMDRRFFHRLGASRLDRTICASTGTAALDMTLGTRLGTEPEQFRHSKCIVAWGANVLATNVHLWPFIVEARRNGAKFYVIDPLPTRTAQLADVHLAINPGADAALALAMMHVIFRERLEDNHFLTNYCNGHEELREVVKDHAPAKVAEMTGLDAGEIEQLALDYASMRPAVIRLNYGVQRSEYGGMACHAISLLPAIVGSWKEVGGGLQLSTSSAFNFNRKAMERSDLQRQSPLGREARILNMSELGRLLTTPLDPPVKAMVVYNSNPAAIAPNLNRVREGLRREDLFTVVLEQFQTDTADYADILLPVTTFLEHPDLYYAYGHYFLQYAPAVLPAPGECKSNFEIFRLLAAAMRLNEPSLEDSEDQMMEAALDTDDPFFEGITLSELKRRNSMRLKVSPPGEPFRPHARGSFATPSGKCEFFPERLNYLPPKESRHGSKALRESFPLELISAKHRDAMNSTFGNREDLHDEFGYIFLNRKDAEDRSIADGDFVDVTNMRGSVSLKARLSDRLRPGIVSIPAVRWSKASGDGQSVNVLTSDVLNDMGGGPSFFSCLVQVMPSIRS